MFQVEQNTIEQKIKTICAAKNISEPVFEWKNIPFSGHWGISMTFFQTAAREAREGKKIKVNERAQEIAETIAAALGIPEGYEKVEAVKGYLNLYYSTAEYARRVIDGAIEQGTEFGRGPRTHEKIMVEFSQPNTHKAFHVGHLRNMILGDSVCRLLDFAGSDVIRANYPGDIGLHVIKWLWNYIKRHAGETPSVDLTRWMGDLYAEADRSFNESLEAQAEVRALYTRWDQRDPEIVELWKKTRQWSIEGFHQIYDLLDVQFDRYYFPSEVEDAGKKMVDLLIEKKLARDERPEGAVYVPLDEILGLKEKYRVLVVLRSDGTSLYSTEDLALAIQKFKDYDLTRSIYVIDVRQSLYMQQIYKVMELLGFAWANRCYHLPYEIVNLPGNVTMSSRDGTVVLLEDLVREAKQRALAVVKEKNPELAEQKQFEIANAVALGAIKYSMLARDHAKIVTFDWDAALDFNGQAAPYIQYAHVRAGSILRKAGGVIPPSLTPDYPLSKAEIELIEQISRLPQDIQRAAADLRVLNIASMAYDLAKAFSNFYNECPVIQAEPAVRDVRLRLVAATRQAIANVLSILGIQAPDAM